jgi:hypothetical protein
MHPSSALEAGDILAEPSRVVRAQRRDALFAEYLVSPLHQRHQIRRGYKPSILAVEVGVADRTGP